jgi:ribosomal protein S18 acetylase RimI-like enzyme
MEIRNLHDKEEIYKFLSINPELHIYAIGDLDDFFWSKTMWFCICDNNTILSIALLYTGMVPATLILLHNGTQVYAKELLTSIRPFLPSKIMVHLSSGLIGLFGKKDILKDYGLHYRMVLKKEPIEQSDKNIRKLNVVDILPINQLLSVAYPENWFDKRMLETDMYYGYFNGEALIGMAGVHVYSEHYKIAALGNITTHPDFRGRGIASKLTSRVCYELNKKVTVIGLNVTAANISAIKCYEKLGFAIYSSYDECYLVNN